MNNNPVMPTFHTYKLFFPLVGIQYCRDNDNNKGRKTKQKEKYELSFKTVYHKKPL